jgi:holo-[acyl-carrier protein] synthase
MIVGVGIDLVEIARVEAVIQRRGDRFVERVFTPVEIAYCRSHRASSDRFAARFAAKEAAMKALGTGWRAGIRWRDFEVRNAASGQPELLLTGRAREVFWALGGERILLSLSHAEAYAVAQVIIEGRASRGSAT